MTIPKTIHYCMFGSKEIPNHIKKCMNSWGKLKGFEFIEWNEDKFDINYSKFTKESYDAKKYAYVSDVCRLYALYNYGGIYLDTDILINGDFNKLLNNKVFLGFIFDTHLGTAVIGSEKENQIIKELLNEYQNLTLETAPVNNNELFTKFFLKHSDFKLNNKEQLLNCGVHIYPKESFEMPTFKRKIDYSTHISFGSWRPTSTSMRAKIKKMLVNVPGSIFLLFLQKRILARKGSKMWGKYYGEYIKEINRSSIL